MVIPGKSIVKFGIDSPDFFRVLEIHSAILELRHGVFNLKCQILEKY